MPRGVSLERTLQWMLGTLVTLVLLAITATGAWVGREATVQFVASRLEHDGEAIIAAVDIDAGAVTRSLPPVYSQPLSGHYFVVQLGDGRELRSRSLWDAALDTGTLAPGLTARALRDGPRGQRLVVWRGGYEKQGQALTIAVTEDIAPLLATLNRFSWAGVALTTVAAVLLVWLQRRLLRRGFRQLDRVRADVRRLGRGEAGQLREDVPAEVQPLVHELNHLIAVWQGHLQRSRNAAGNLAHALKSPLQLLMQRGGESNDTTVSEQATRMRQLIERELRRARLAGSATPAHLFVPAADTADLVATLEALYRERTLEITTDIHAPAHLPFDQEDMLELIGNLLDNAAKWASRRVILGVTAGDDAVRIQVEDDGPGIDPAEAAALLARGTRLDERTPGHGLGLAIVRDIAELYGGRINMGRSDTLGGLAVTLELPFHPEPQGAEGR